MRVASIAGPALAALALAGPAAAAPTRILYVGDSLGVGTTPLLERELGSSAQIEGDSEIGRPSGVGLQVLAQRLQPADRIVVFDLGTNDDPARPAALAGDLKAARRASGERCMIVATLNRPPLNGVPVDGLNHAVLAFASAARNVQLVDWNAIVASEPDLLGPDHVHPTPQGYALRAQYFAQAVAGCESAAAAAPPLLAPATPGKRSRRHAPTPRPRIKAPGMESSGISFTEPLRFRGHDAQLLLPNSRPPYPAVVMLRGAEEEAEFFAAHGIATLRYRDLGSVADARAAVELLRRLKDVRPGAIALWGFGPAADRAARAAAGNRDVAALAVMSAAALPVAEQRDWEARRRLDAGAPAVTSWWRLRARMDAGLRADPATAWRRVAQPVLAIWGSRDDRVPIRASAAALRDALAAGPNRDRTFHWVDAGHGGVVSYRGGEPQFAPGLLEEMARWLGQRLGARRAQPALDTPLPPANRGPQAVDVARASALYALPFQVAWLALPALMLTAAAFRMGRAGSRIGPDPVAAPPALVAAAAAAGAASFAAIAGGVALALPSGGPLATIAGVPWPFAVARVFAVALGALAVVLARRRAFMAAAAALIWVALALFWLL